MTFAQLGERFAAKSGTQESLFKLKSQMKSIIELLVSVGVIQLDDHEDKPNEGETAMFLKKPLGGFSCASCEKNIKQVSNKAGSNYQHWKRMPVRDPMDRLPRAG